MASDGGIDDGAVVERVLPVKLTEAELVERGQRMALAELKIETLKSERKLLNARIGEQVETRAALASVIDNGVEDRAVKCKWSADYTAKVWTLRRLDTSDEVDRRDMTADDLQTIMDIDDDRRSAIARAQLAADDAKPLVDPDGVAVLDWSDAKKRKPARARLVVSKRASKRPPPARAKTKGKRPKARAHANA